MPVIFAVNEPAPVVQEILLPLVGTAKTGFAPVLPIGIWPFVAAPRAVKALLPCASSRLFAVSPELAPIFAKNGTLLPFTVNTCPVVPAEVAWSAPVPLP